MFFIPQNPRFIKAMAMVKRDFYFADLTKSFWASCQISG